MPTTACVGAPEVKERPALWRALVEGGQEKLESEVEIVAGLVMVSHELPHLATKRPIRRDLVRVAVRLHKP